MLQGSLVNNLLLLSNEFLTMKKKNEKPISQSLHFKYGRLFQTKPTVWFILPKEKNRERVQTIRAQRNKQQILKNLPRRKLVVFRAISSVQSISFHSIT